MLGSWAMVKMRKCGCAELWASRQAGENRCGAFLGPGRRGAFNRQESNCCRWQAIERINGRRHCCLIMP